MDGELRKTPELPCSCLKVGANIFFGRSILNQLPRAVELELESEVHSTNM